jgi:hypothetical protein
VSAGNGIHLVSRARGEKDFGAKFILHAFHDTTRLCARAGCPSSSTSATPPGLKASPPRID